VASKLGASAPVKVPQPIPPAASVLSWGVALIIVGAILTPIGLASESPLILLAAAASLAGLIQLVKGVHRLAAKADWRHEQEWIRARAEL
jgi:hypothetical protein